MEPIQPLRTTQYDHLPVEIYRTNEEVGQAAAQVARNIITTAIADKGNANLILATGNSQLTFLKALREMPGIDWSKARVFHMDEYLDLSPDHPASFPLFLHRHFLDFVQVGAFYTVAAQAEEVEPICRDYTPL